MVRNRFRRMYSPMLLLGLAMLLFQCVSSRMSDKAVATYFENAPVKPSFHTISTQGRVIHYAVIGSIHSGPVHSSGSIHSGADSLPVVVFVHGSPGSWAAFIAFFNDSTLYQRARLVSVDRLGFGKSGVGRMEGSLQKQAAAVAAVIHAETPSGRAVLVGHSLGGPVVARVAMDYPDRVSSLILVAPSIDPELEDQKWYRPVLSAFPFRQLLPAGLDVSNREIRSLRSELRLMLPLWSSVRVPVLVIQGDADKLVPPGNADFARRMLVNAPVTIQLISGMNHFIPWRRPDLIQEAILHQLTTNPLTRITTN